VIEKSLIKLHIGPCTWDQVLITEHSGRFSVRIVEIKHNVHLECNRLAPDLLYCGCENYCRTAMY
jgi:hypothetical protein